MSIEAYKIELEKTKESLFQITNKRIKLFRPPYGVTTPSIAKAVKNNYTCIGWNIRSLDTVSSQSRQQVYDRIVKRIKPGSVILLHDRCKDADILTEMILIYLRNNKIGTNTIDELFSIKAYED